MNEVLTAIADRSSIRAYTDEKLSEEEIRTLVTAGLQAPTAANKQEVHTSVVSGGDPVLAEIDEERRRLVLASDADEAFKENVKNSKVNFYYSAPTVLVLSVDKSFYWGKLDAGIAVENISLAAHSLGLGSLIIGCIDAALKGEKGADFAKALKFPENYEFAIAVAVGHKNTEKTPHEFDYEKSVSKV